jgi:methionyl-tRNA formyltransferase
MNILFAGSPKSASRILKYLVGVDGAKIKGVLTKPNKRGKRGNELLHSEVAKVANGHNLRLLKPISLNDKGFKDEVASLNIDFLIVTAYGKLLPEWLIRLPKNHACKCSFFLYCLYIVVLLRFNLHLLMGIGQIWGVIHANDKRT